MSLSTFRENDVSPMVLCVSLLSKQSKCYRRDAVMASHMIRYCHITSIIVLTVLVVAPVETSFVQLGPTEDFKLFSEIIFPGEVLQLECVAPNVTNCEILLYLNNTVIYQSGRQLHSGSYNITKDDSLCLLTILMINVTAQHKGIYKCQVHNEDTTMMDTFKLNVVTKWPHCLAKCVESENSFQLYCYTSSPPNDPPVFMTWEITEPGRDPMTFTDFVLSRLSKGSIAKSVGVSHQNIQKENVTSLGFRCFHIKDPSQNCFVNLTSPVINDVTSPKITTKLPTPKTSIKRTLRHTSTLPTLKPDIHEQTFVNPIWYIIISSVTTAIVILSVIVLMKMYKMKKELLSKERKKETDSRKRNDSVQTGIVVSSSHDKGGLELSTYAEIPEDSEARKYETKIFRNETEMPNTHGDSKQQLYERRIERSKAKTPEIIRESKEHNYETKIDITVN